VPTTIIGESSLVADGAQRFERIADFVLFAAGGQPNEPFVRRLADLRRRQDNLGQLVQPLLLLFNQELGVTDQIE
jgi:hypothetical protein